MSKFKDDQYKLCAQHTQSSLSLITNLVAHTQYTANDTSRSHRQQGAAHSTTVAVTSYKSFTLHKYAPHSSALATECHDLQSYARNRAMIGAPSG